MKKTTILSTLSTIFLLLVLMTLPVNAGEIRRDLREMNQNRREIKHDIKQGRWGEVKKDIKELREDKRELREDLKEKGKNIFQRVEQVLKNKVGKIFHFQARITGKISAIGDNSLTVNNIQVNITGETQLVRRFAGKSELSEFSVGDTVNVFGKWANEEKTAIDARLIRNLSIQRRWGVFFGKVNSKVGDSFMMVTLNRGSQTVYFTAATKFVNRKGEIISFDDVQVGHRVRVKGVWDRALNKIIDVEEVKDFSLPPIPTKT